MVLIDGRKHVFSFNLSSFEKQLETQLGLESQIFIRLGKSLIINSKYIYSINVPAQELILSCSSIPGEFILKCFSGCVKIIKVDD